MESLREALDKIFTEEIYKCVISNPVKKDEKYKKVNLSLLEGEYFVEKYTDTQVFHEKKGAEDAKAFVLTLLASAYKSFHAWSDDFEYNVQISKKGKISFGQKKADGGSAPEKKTSYNREKNYILKQGTCIEPLVDMGIFTPEGKVIQSMYDKYRQINRFIEIVDDEIKKTKKTELTVLDFGCGKSYLTFVLYYYFTEIRKLKIKMIGLDLKRDVIEKCNKTAQKYGYENLSFETGDIGDYSFEGKIDVIITLHACDTATDYALYNAIEWNAEMIFSVPCCQHELNAQMKTKSFEILTRYGLVKERFASLVTDVIRCNLLEYCGYKTQMVEFVAFEHTPKNIMIRAVKRGGKKKESALAEVKAVMEEFALSPTLYRLLENEYIN